MKSPEAGANRETGERDIDDGAQLLWVTFGLSRECRSKMSLVWLRDWRLYDPRNC